MSIYLDNAAAAPIDPRVKNVMICAMKLVGNPSSYNDSGRQAREELEDSRRTTAAFLGAHVDEVVFTSSGSEANNLAIKGLIQTGDGGKEIITTPIEHLSVLEPLRQHSYRGIKVVYVRVDNKGLVDLKDLECKLSKNTLLVSVMYANNEIGTIEPISKISRLLRRFKNSNKKSNTKYPLFPLFHSDACQATGYLNMNVNYLGVDLLTLNGAKINGPRGIGVLYKRRGVYLQPQVLGGSQEFGLRAGTENLPAISGLAKAISLINKKDSTRIQNLRDYFIKGILERIPDAHINGPEGGLRLSNNINISFSRMNSENVLLELDKYGVRAGGGSACTARSVEPPHVLKAIGVEKKYFDGAIRFSLGRQTTKKDIDYVLKVLPKIIFDLKNRYKTR